MIKVQIDQYDMVLTTQKLLQKNAAIYASNAALTASTIVLGSKIATLDVEIAKQLVRAKGITIDKRNIRKALEGKAFVLGSACCSYASVSGDVAFYKRCRYTKSDLLHFRDVELIGICVNLYKDAEDHAAALSLYNVDEAMLADFQSSTTDFSKVMSNPVEAIARRAAATAQIAVLLREILELLKVRLDNDIVSMRASQPDFVSTYYNVRAINKSRVSKRSLVVKAFDTLTNAPIAEVGLEIIGRGIRRKSGESGHNRIQNLAPGSHIMKASHRDYEIQRRKFTVVSGETTELVLMMNKKSDVPSILDEPLVDAVMANE